jgi:hypothetical protein
VDGGEEGDGFFCPAEAGEGHREPWISKPVLTP